jgi:hypothetical protein
MLSPSREHQKDGKSTMLFLIIIGWFLEGEPGNRTQFSNSFQRKTPPIYVLLLALELIFRPLGIVILKWKYSRKQQWKEYIVVEGDLGSSPVPRFQMRALYCEGQLCLSFTCHY